MFSDILNNVNIDLESSINVSDDLVKLIKLVEQLHLQYNGKQNWFFCRFTFPVIYIYIYIYITLLESKTKLDDGEIEVSSHENQLSMIERERVELMSELALQMQTKVRIHYINYCSW